MGDRRPKIQYEQLPLAFMTEDRGDAPVAGPEGIESPTAKRGPENPATGESLMEEVCERENLEQAWQQVRSNQGSPGGEGGGGKRKKPQTGGQTSPLQQGEPRRRGQAHRRDPGLPA